MAKATVSSPGAEGFWRVFEKGKESASNKGLYERVGVFDVDFKGLGLRGRRRRRLTG